MQHVWGEDTMRSQTLGDVVFIYFLYLDGNLKNTIFFATFSSVPLSSRQQLSDIT